MGGPTDKNMMADARAKDPTRTAAFDAKYAAMTANRQPTDPTQLANFQNAWNTAKQNGGVVQAGTPPPTVAPPPTMAPTTNDATMGPSYMPQQPVMTGAPVAAPPPPPPAPKPKTPAKKKTTSVPTTPAPAKKYTLMMPPNLYGAGAQYAQQVIDNYNRTGGNDPVAYMNARDELARVASMSTRRRYNDTPGAGHGGSGGNYGSSGPSSGGGRLA